MRSDDSNKTHKKSLIRAAQYVRMSTDHQEYSTANQSDVILDYAERHGFEIVKTYMDEGKSGLRIEGRNALSQLIADVQTGESDFAAILVYDVSRWGRFQDTDESAYYEYACKRAGINVYYCAEQFDNDGSPVSTIIKSVKRAMAGEYSRELSMKVFQGQCRLIQLGFRQGGSAGYGLRRMLVDQSGQPKGLLKRGEHKCLQTDRVVLVTGPQEEQNVIRRIYHLFTKDGLKESQIANRLNAEGIPGENGRSWSRSIIRQILTNEKYIGHNVYNRVSFKLKKRRVRNPPEMWVRKDDAFDPIVDAQQFYIARGVVVERSRVYSDDELISLLRDILVKHGTLSSSLIDSSEHTPSSTAYRHRFGGLIEAYRRAGYDPGRDYSYIEINRGLKVLHPQIMDRVVTQLQGLGADVVFEPKDETLLINREYRVSIVLSKFRQTVAGSPRWLIRFGNHAKPDLTLMVRMDASNIEPEDYYLLPHLDVTDSQLRLGQHNGAAIDTYRFATLTYFMAMAVRERIEVAT